MTASLLHPLCSSFGFDSVSTKTICVLSASDSPFSCMVIKLTPSVHMSAQVIIAPEFCQNAKSVVIKNAYMCHRPPLHVIKQNHNLVKGCSEVCLTRSVFWILVLAETTHIPVLQLPVNWILRWEIQNRGRNFISLWHVTGRWNLLRWWWNGSRNFSIVLRTTRLSSLAEPSGL